MTGFFFMLPIAQFRSWEPWTFFYRRTFPVDPQPLTLLLQCRLRNGYSIVFAKRFHRNGVWKFIPLL